MPNGYMQTAKSYMLPKHRVQWTERLLVLSGYTGSVHWFRDDGNSGLTTLGVERGQVRLSDVARAEVSPLGEEEASGSAEEEKVLTLFEARTDRRLLAFRASADIVEAWKRAIELTRDRADESRQCLQAAQAGTDDPPEPPEAVGVDSKIEFQDPRIQYMGFAYRYVGESLSTRCAPFMNQGLKLKLCVVGRSQIRLFEPSEKLLFGKMEEALDLSSMKKINPGEKRGSKSFLNVQFSMGRLIMLTPHTSDWKAALELAQERARAEKSGEQKSSRRDKTSQNGHASPGEGVLRWPFPRDEALTRTELGSDLGRMIYVWLLWNGSLALWLRTSGRMDLTLLVVANVLLLGSVVTVEGAPGATLALVEAMSKMRGFMFGNALKEPSRPTDGRGAEEHRRTVDLGPEIGCASDGDTSSVFVRGVDYLQTKKKVPTEPAFYELHHLEILSAPAAGGKHLHIGAQGAMLAQDNFDGEVGALPKFIIVNLQLPVGAPSLLAKNAACDCSSVVFYFRIRASTEAIPTKEVGDPALELLRRFCTEAPTNRALQDRLKVICSVTSLSGKKLPSALKNLRPAMVGKAATLFQGPGYLELDLDVSTCQYHVQKSLHHLRELLGDMQVLFSVVVQGESERELPERLLACATLRGVQLHSQPDRAPEPAEPRTSEPPSPGLPRQVSPAYLAAALRQRSRGSGQAQVES